jgi:hypothetical protein
MVLYESTLDKIKKEYQLEKTILEIKGLNEWRQEVELRSG